MLGERVGECVLWVGGGVGCTVGFIVGGCVSGVGGGVTGESVGFGFLVRHFVVGDSVGRTVSLGVGVMDAGFLVGGPVDG